MTTIHPNNFVVTLWTGANQDNNRITLSGWSDAAVVITFPDVELYANIRQGLDGILLGTLNSRFSGDVAFEFMSNSPSVKWFQDRVTELRGGVDVVVNGQVINNTTKEVCNLNHGLLRMGRPFPNFGTDGTSVMPFTIRFADLPADYSNFIAGMVDVRENS